MTATNALQSRRHGFGAQYLQRGETPLHELVGAFKAWPIWVYLSLNDIRSKYRRATLGPLWLVLGTAIALSGMALAWSVIFGLDWRNYVPYMIAGMLSWQFIANYINQSCNLFASEYAGLIQSLPSPPIIYALRFVMSGLWLFLHYLPFWICVALFTGTWPSLTSIPFFILGLFLTLVSALGVSVTMGMLGARFRDLTPAVTALMTPAMMLTPVMWKPEMIGDYAIFARLNPLAHYVEVLRAPLLGQPPAALSLAAAGGMSILWLLIGFVMYRRYRHVLVLWV